MTLAEISTRLSRTLLSVDGPRGYAHLPKPTTMQLRSYGLDSADIETMIGGETVFVNQIGYSLEPLESE